MRIVIFSLFFYDGYIGKGGITVFLVDNGGLITNNVADALNSIGAIESERILRKSFKLFPNSVKVFGLFQQCLPSASDAAYANDVVLRTVMLCLSA